MRKWSLIAVIFILPILLCGCWDIGNDTGKKIDAQQPLLRLHIRANSNEPGDQAVKLEVRDAVCAYFTDELSGVLDFETAKKEVAKRIAWIQRICDGILRDNGFSYQSTANLCNEYFPTRVYGNLTVECGYYDAVVIALGNGTGDNWWCVVYPPLCYLEAESDSDFMYKSIIAEWWSKRK